VVARTSIIAFTSQTLWLSMHGIQPIWIVWYSWFVLWILSRSLSRWLMLKGH